MPNQNEDVISVLTEFARQAPDTVLIGGLAVQAYGGERLTEDVDFIPSMAPNDWQNTTNVLKNLDFIPVSGYTWEQLENLDTLTKISENRAEIRFRHQKTGVKLDLLIGYAQRYESYSTRARMVEVDDVKICLASINDLIELKRESSQIADRWKDKLDLEFLESLPKDRTC